VVAPITLLGYVEEGLRLPWASLADRPDCAEVEPLEPGNPQRQFELLMLILMVAEGASACWAEASFVLEAAQVDSDPYYGSLPKVLHRWWKHYRLRRSRLHS
jgi:hypothetical protein